MVISVQMRPLQQQFADRRGQPRVQVWREATLAFSEDRSNSKVFFCWAFDSAVRMKVQMIVNQQAL